MVRKRVRLPPRGARNDVETHAPAATVTLQGVETESTTTTAHTTLETVETAAPSVRGVSDAVVQGEEDAISERRSKRPRSGAILPVPVQTGEDVCHACGSAAIASMALLTCSSCHVAVHAHCYALPMDASAVWTCESCADHSEEPRSCVFCLQPADACMRRVATARWPAAYRPADTEEQEDTAWAHAMCALWNPFNETPTPQATIAAELVSTDHDAVNATTETETPVPATQASTITDRMSDPLCMRLELPVPPCSFCEDAQGVRIQCRRLHCGRFFHVRCAHASQHGFVLVAHTPFPLAHAYCDRHHLPPHADLQILTTKLLSKTMASLVPRDVITKVQTIVRRLDSFASVDAVLMELVPVLEDMCKKGLAISKTDPPTFSMRQLQALQFVLDHLPQLRNVYNVSTLSKTGAADLVHDADIVHALQKAFSPQRFVRKFAGPLSVFHQCDACHEPFQERQHIFYCVSSEQPHALHWKCTKRKSAPKESSSSRQGSGGGSASGKKKPKALSLVQQGHWKDVKLPKGLPSLGEGATCSVCRAAVDARGILAGRKEASRMDYEKPNSEFMYGGCFVNEMDPRAAAAAGLRTSRATNATASVQSGTMVGGLRVPGKSALRRSASGASANMDSDGEASASLGPPKLDRVNVRRTTRWVACLAQVIRLVLAAKKEAKAAEAARLAKEKEQGTKVALSTEDTVAESAPHVDENLTVSPDTQDVDCSEKVGVATGETSGDVEMSEAPTESSPAELVATEAAGGDANIAESLVTSEVAPDEPHREVTAEIATTDQVETPAIVKQELVSILVSASASASASARPPPSSSLPAPALAYLEEAKRVVRPYDAYALNKMESAHRMFDERNGPALSVLNTLIQEYTRFLYVKHTRAVAKATNEKRKRQEVEAQEERERERKRIDREAEQALKKQMLAMRKKQRA